MLCIKILNTHIKRQRPSRAVYFRNGRKRGGQATVRTKLYVSHKGPLKGGEEGPGAHGANVGVTNGWLR